MNTIIDNNQRKFLLIGKGWNTQSYVCNMADIVACAKEFEPNQPYAVSHLWNGAFKRLRVKEVIDILEGNQLDASFFKKTKSVYPGNISN